MKKKVLFLINTLNTGGAEKVLIDILNNINYNKYEVDLVVLHQEGKYIDKVNKNVHVKYIFKKNSCLNNKIYNFVKYNYYKKFGKQFYRKYINKSYDVEIAFLEGFTTYLISNSTNRSSKKISWIHTDISKGDIGISKKVFKNSFKNIDQIVCVSKEAKDSFKKVISNIDDEKISVIYNPVDIINIKEKSLEKLLYKKEAMTVISVGRLEKVKRFDRLIRIHKKLIDEGINHRFIIIGDGKEKDNLNQYIRDLNIENTFKLIGFDSNPYKWIKMSDMLVLSSEYEGFSLVVAEAMILNKPIVSTNLTGPNELLKRGEYGLITENNEIELYKGIKKMLLNEELRESYKNKLSKINIEFDIRVIMNKIEFILDND